MRVHLGIDRNAGDLERSRSARTELIGDELRRDVEPIDAGREPRLVCEVIGDDARQHAVQAAGAARVAERDRREEVRAHDSIRLRCSEVLDEWREQRDVEPLA